MTLKKFTGSTLRFILSLIPFYWVWKYFAQNKPFDHNNKKNYRLASWLLGMTICSTVGLFLFPQLFIPLLGVGLGMTLGIILSVIICAGIMPTLLETAVTKFVKTVIWIMYHNDTTVIVKTNPMKYKAFIHYSTSEDPEQAIKQVEDNNATQEAMEKLYRKKQEIKDNPDGWLGLSDEQKVQCREINSALQYFRHHSLYGGSYEKSRWRLSSEHDSSLNREKINPNPHRFHSNFLNNIIDEPEEKAAIRSESKA